MGKKTYKALIKLTHAEASIAQKIYEFREVKVMLSGDLADLYGVQSRVLESAGKTQNQTIPEALYVQIDESGISQSFKIKDHKM